MHTCWAVAIPSELGITWIPPSICWMTPDSRRAESETSSPNDFMCKTALIMELLTFSASVSKRAC